MGSERWSIELDFAVVPKPRWGHGTAPHRELDRIIGSHRDVYAGQLRKMKQAGRYP